MDPLGVRIAVASLSTPVANVPGTENARFMIKGIILRNYPLLLVMEELFTIRIFPHTPCRRPRYSM